MTGRTIVILALVATILLAVGARLLDGESTGAATGAIVLLVIGTALAATAVAGAWRPPSAGSPEADPAPVRTGRR